jgi:hypothetical protein
MCVQSSDTFPSAVGAALGGFIGVILFFLIRLLIEWGLSGKKFIRSYLCASKINQGQPTESDGELRHHHGRRVVDAAELRRFGASHAIWEWTRDPVGRDSGDSTIFGPYTTDFDEPGLYSVVFRIRALGLSRPSEIMNDLILLELDVNSTIPQITPMGTGIIQVGAQRKIARKYIRTSELAQGGWMDYELKFYSDCQGVWEYRVMAFDGLGNRPDNLATLGGGAKILFDTVSIFRLKKIVLPWA